MCMPFHPCQKLHKKGHADIHTHTCARMTACIAPSFASWGFNLHKTFQEQCVDLLICHCLIQWCQATLEKTPHVGHACNSNTRNRHCAEHQLRGSEGNCCLPLASRLHIATDRINLPTKPGRIAFSNPLKVVLPSHTPTFGVIALVVAEQDRVTSGVAQALAVELQKIPGLHRQVPKAQEWVLRLRPPEDDVLHRQPLLVLRWPPH
mmetsp:Transcript_60794/g.100458  ORF Transcript_60794/g.100458 Transcript_60794/m.100458 type:complete len:206 (-) Transcript_60794:3315-3932(-)